MKHRNLLLKIHFGLLLLVFFNFVLKLFTDVSLGSYVIFPVKITIYVSGLILLFLTIKPFEKKAIYFSLYLLSPLAVFLSWVADGIFGAIVGSLFMWAITVDDSISTTDKYIISKPFAGFLAPCCRYNLKRNYFYVAEKKIGEFQIEGSDLNSAKFSVSRDERTLNLKYQSTDFNNKTIEVDTAINLSHGIETIRNE